MSKNCAQIPENKKQYISDIGKILVKENGKKKYYKPYEVKKAHQNSSWGSGLDFSCWGIAVFSSHLDFEEYHNETGEICDYTEMKSEMLQGLSSVEIINQVDLSNLDIDASWLDFGEIFGNIFEGIGELITGILD